MSLLPEIKDGKLVDEPQRNEVYTPPKIVYTSALRDEAELLGELNNHGLPILTEDFSDSPALRGD